MALLQHFPHFLLVVVGRGAPSLHLHMVIAFISFVLEKHFTILHNR